MSRGVGFGYSQVRIPVGFVSEYGVEDGQEFTSTSDEGDFGGLTFLNKTVIKGFDGLVPTNGREGGHVQGRTDIRPATPNTAFTPERTRVTVEGS